jgi:hypothetical protein
MSKTKPKNYTRIYYEYDKYVDYDDNGDAWEIMGVLKQLGIDKYPTFKFTTSITKEEAWASYKFIVDGKLRSATEEEYEAYWAEKKREWILKAIKEIE